MLILTWTSIFLISLILLFLTILIEVRAKNKLIIKCILSIFLLSLSYISLMFINKYQKENQKFYTIEYKIKSIKMDDESEYHIIATSYFNTISLNDISSKDVIIHYSNFYTFPKLIEYCKDPYGQNKYKYKPLNIYLPIWYKIDIFND